MRNLRHLTLGELIEELSLRDSRGRVLNGFGSWHPYHGNGADVGFEPAHMTTIGLMLVQAKDALRNEGVSYNGNWHVMRADSLTYLAEWGGYGEPITEFHLECWDRETNAFPWKTPVRVQI